MRPKQEAAVVDSQPMKLALFLSARLATWASCWLHVSVAATIPLAHASLVSAQTEGASWHASIQGDSAIFSFSSPHIRKANRKTRLAMRHYIQLGTDDSWTSSIVKGGSSKRIPPIDGATRIASTVQPALNFTCRLESLRYLLITQRYL